MILQADNPHGAIFFSKMLKKIKDEKNRKGCRKTFFEKIVFVEVNLEKKVRFLPITCSKIKIYEKK